MCFFVTLYIQRLYHQKKSFYAYHTFIAVEYKIPIRYRGSCDEPHAVIGIYIIINI